MVYLNIRMSDHDDIQKSVVCKSRAFWIYIEIYIGNDTENDTVVYTVVYTENDTLMYTAV